jgi:hypothetical protein
MFPGRLVVCAGVLTMGAWITAGAQQPCPMGQCGSSTRTPMGGQGQGRGGVQQNPTQPSSIPGIMEPDGPLNPRMEEQQAKMRNMDRQKQIVADTQKLLALANQLNAYVEKSNKDTLSLDVIRKADEIEKLAKAVKEKMKGS